MTVATAPGSRPMAGDEEFAANEATPKSGFQYMVYSISKSPLTMVGLGIVVFYVLVALFAPMLAPPVEGQQNPLELPVFTAPELQAPDDAHRFGTGEFGVDLYYGVVWGARVSMAMGLAVTLSGIVIGLILGLVSGYFGGWIDDVIMRVTDIFLSLPLLVLAIAMAVAFSHNPVDWNLHIGPIHLYHLQLGRTLDTVALTLIVTWWPTYTRLVRGQVLALRESQFVEAARASGLKEWRIMWRHILPNSLSPIIVQWTLDIGVVVLVAASLAFLGFTGSSSSLAEWGSLVAKGQNYMATGQWWTFVFPGLAIFGFALGFNLLGDGLRDLTDPRLRK